MKRSREDIASEELDDKLFPILAPLPECFGGKPARERVSRAEDCKAENACVAALQAIWEQRGKWHDPNTIKISKKDQRNLTEAYLSWIKRGDFGLPCIYMFYVFTRINITGRHLGTFAHYPRSPHDWGKCQRMLEAIPEFRSRLSEMSSKSKMWTLWVKIWPKAEKEYYRTGNMWRAMKPVYKAIGETCLWE